MLLYSIVHYSTVLSTVLLLSVMLSLSLCTEASTAEAEESALQQEWMTASNVRFVLARMYPRAQLGPNEMWAPHSGVLEPFESKGFVYGISDIAIGARTPRLGTGPDRTRPLHSALLHNRTAKHFALLNKQTHRSGHHCIAIAGYLIYCTSMLCSELSIRYTVEEYTETVRGCSVQVEAAARTMRELQKFV